MFCRDPGKVGLVALSVKKVALTFSDCTAKTDSSYHDEKSYRSWTEE